MGIDGFSLSNLGLNKNMTSAQLANEAEALARQSTENQISDVDGVGKREKAGKKDDEAAYNGTIPFIPDDKKDGEDEQNQQEQEVSNMKTEVNSDDEEVSKYKFVFGKGDMIEIQDSTTGELIKKIPITQAQKAVGSIDKLPGFLVNREV